MRVLAPRLEGCRVQVLGPPVLCSCVALRVRQRAGRSSRRAVSPVLGPAVLPFRVSGSACVMARLHRACAGPPRLAVPTPEIL